MSKKCALYLRVSTDLQDSERQRKDLEEFSKSNSFILKDENIYQDNLSGHKNATHRKGLNTLLTTVENKEIDVVLVWEISRLSRNQTELLRIKDIFKNNSINIYFYTEGLWLFDANTMKINPFAELLISFLGWTAEYETRLTKERFHSKKKLYVKQGKYNGGFITFGYTISKFGKTDNDSDKKFILNDEIIAGLKVSQVDIVKEVFNLYEQGKVCSEICFKCRVKDYPKIVCSTHTLARLLRNTSYIGYKYVKLGKRPTPRIIEGAQFENVQKLLDSNKTKAHKGKKHIYLLRGILRCKYCNKHYVGKQTDDSYICPCNSSSNKINKGTSCEGGNISISNIDGIIWERIKEIWINREHPVFDKKYDSTNDVSKEDDIQKNHFNERKEKCEERIRKAVRVYDQDGYNDEQFDTKLDEIKQEMKLCDKGIIELERKIRNKKSLIESSNTLSNRKKDINSITDRMEMRELIICLIENITFTKAGLFQTIVNIEYYGDKSEFLIYNSVAKRGNLFKLFNSKYSTYDVSSKRFFVLKRKYHSILLPNHSSKEYARLELKLRDAGPLNPSVSDIFDFNTLMNHQDIPCVLKTREYTKLTYFKELNKKRFSRKKSVKQHNSSP